MASGKRLLAGSSEREQALLQARESYRALVEQVPAILYTEVILEGEELPLYVSPHLKEVLGVSQQEFMRRETWGAMLHPEDRDRVVRENEEWLCGGPDVGDYRIVRPDGDVVWIRDRATMTRDEVSGLRFVRGIFVDVTELKRAEEIITHQVERLRKVDRIGRDFTGLVLGGASLQQILEGLSTIVGDPVVLEDSSHNLVGAAGRTEAVDSVIDDWQAHSRIDHEALEPGLARVEGEHPCTWIAISLRGEPWGRMHMIEAGRSIDEVDALALDRAAAAVSLSLLSKRDGDGPAEAAGGALVADILQGRYASSTEILRRARAVGANLDGRTLACLAIILPLTRGILGEPAVGDPRGGELPPEVLRTVRDVVRAARCTALMALDGARILIVVRVSEEQEAREVLTGLGEAVLGRIDTRFGMKAVAGATTGASAGTLRRGLENALEAAAFGVQDGSVSYFDDLGVRHLLRLLSEGPELAHFVESTMKPLLDHDAKTSSRLVPTLRAYVDHAGSKSATARSLHIDRRTLYHRLERIERLLGRSLDGADANLELAISLRGLDLLQSRSGAARR